MVAIEELEIGMKVMIVDEWVDGCYENDVGDMDCWLGQEMTVRALHHGVYIEDNYFIAEEDHGRWAWYMPTIAYIVDDERASFAPVSDITSLYGGG